MNVVLLDTGPLVALLDGSQEHHSSCVAAFAGFAEPLVTCESVISEACHLLRRLKGAARDVVTNLESGMIQVPYRASDRVSAISRLMGKYSDIHMSFADACLVDMAGELGNGRILTLDGDFRVYRWGRNRPFELLLQNV